MKIQQLRGSFLGVLVVFSLNLCSFAEPRPQVGDKADRQLDECTTVVRHYELQDISTNEIISKFQELADSGDVRGKMWIARFYQLGRLGFKADHQEAQKRAKDVISAVTKLANAGDSEAQFLLGSAFQDGLGLDQDLRRAAFWFQKAVDSEHVTAMNNLGVMLAAGCGVDPDIQKARELFARASKGGSRRASENQWSFREMSRNDSDRFSSLRRIPIIQALGLQTNEAVAFLARVGLITNTAAYSNRIHKGLNQLVFKNDGIVMSFEKCGRVMNVEAHAPDSLSSQGYRGGVPLGLTWKLEARETLEMLGDPDDRGYLDSDKAYGLVYYVNNLRFVIMFGYGKSQQIKLWRVYEKWAVKYPATEE